MRKLVLALGILLATSVSAFAQNTQCSDKPSTDSSNACANTRFVQTHVTPPGSISLPNGEILIGSMSGVAAAQAMSGDCTLTNTGAITCTKTNGVPFGTFATQNYATPPAIGGTTPNTAVFSGLTLSAITGSNQCLHVDASGIVSGTGVDCGSGSGSTPTAADFGGRLTLVSGNPNNPTADIIGAQTLYYAPLSGGIVPVYNGVGWDKLSFLSSPTDQVGLSLSLAGSANWAAGSIHDVFIINSGGTPQLATRLWDAGMYPTETQIPNNVAITTNTGANAWTNPSNAFNGTVVQPMANSARIPQPPGANVGLANCIGQDFGSTKIVTKIIVTASSDNTLSGATSSMYQVQAYASNDNVNYFKTTFSYLNVVSNGTSYTININEGYWTPYRYYEICLTGTSGFSLNVAQVQFFTQTAPAAGRRLNYIDGIQVNDATITARTGASTTVSVPAGQATYVGTIYIDPGANGSLSQTPYYGENRLWGVWNKYNQQVIRLQAGVNTPAVSNYTVTQQRWGICQTGFSLTVLSGLAQDFIPSSLLRGFYINAASGHAIYEGGISTNSSSYGFSGTEISATIDNTGPQLGYLPMTAQFNMPPFAGTKTLSCIERVDAGPGSTSAFVDLRSTALVVQWKG